MFACLIPGQVVLVACPERRKEVFRRIKPLNGSKKSHRTRDRVTVLDVTGTKPQVRQHQDQRAR